MLVYIFSYFSIIILYLVFELIQIHFANELLSYIVPTTHYLLYCQLSQSLSFLSLYISIYLSIYIYIYIYNALLVRYYLLQLSWHFVLLNLSLFFLCYYWFVVALQHHLVLFLVTLIYSILLLVGLVVLVLVLVLVLIVIKAVGWFFICSYSIIQFYNCTSASLPCYFFSSKLMGCNMVWSL